MRERIRNFRGKEPIGAHERIGDRGVPECPVTVAALSALAVVGGNSPTETSCRQARIQDRAVKICNVTAEIKFRFFLIRFFDPLIVRPKGLILVNT